MFFIASKVEGGGGMERKWWGRRKWGGSREGERELRSRGETGMRVIGRQE